MKKYFSLEDWINILKKYPGVKGRQDGNASLDISVDESTGKLMFDEQLIAGETIDGLFAERRKKENDNYQYWFDSKELDELDITLKPPSVEDIIKRISF